MIVEDFGKTDDVAATDTTSKWSGISLLKGLLSKYVGGLLGDAGATPTAPKVGANLLVYNGTTWDFVRCGNFRVDLATIAIGSIVTVWTPTSGKKFRLMGGSISVSAACSVLFEDNVAGTTVFRTPKLAADTPYTFDLGNGKLSAAANNLLKATASASANIIGTLYGTEE
jgi:hypothetical protein